MDIFKTKPSEVEPPSPGTQSLLLLFKRCLEEISEPSFLKNGSTDITSGNEGSKHSKAARIFCCKRRSKKDKKVENILSMRKAILKANNGWKKVVLSRIQHFLKVDFGKNQLSSDGSLSNEEKISVLKRVLALSIPNFGCDARMSFLMDKVIQEASIPAEHYFSTVESTLLQEIKTGYLEEQGNLEAQKSRRKKIKKRFWIGVGAIAGGVALVITAGLAAPLILPLMATLFGVAFLTTVTASTLFVIVMGVGGSGLASFKVNKRFRDIKDFAFVLVDASVERFRITIALSGIIMDESDLVDPWISIDSKESEVYTVRCQMEDFIALGKKIHTFVESMATNVAIGQALKQTALQTFLSAVALPATVIQAGGIIDNPWSVCLNLAEKEGLILADAISNRAQGHRPVSLCGYSLGAYSIIHCLKQLCKDYGKHVGVILNVLIVGAPIKIEKTEWQKMRSLVTGRFIHGYSRKDWVLQYLHRGTSLTMGEIAGLNPIDDVEGVENFDLSDIVSGHMDYRVKMKDIIELVGLNSIS